LTPRRTKRRAAPVCLMSRSVGARRRVSVAWCRRNRFSLNLVGSTIYAFAVFKFIPAIIIIIMVFLSYCFLLFKRKHRMYWSLKQEGTRRGKLAGTGGQKGDMFWESTGPVDNFPSDAPLGGKASTTFVAPSPLCPTMVQCGIAQRELVRKSSPHQTTRPFVVHCRRCNLSCTRIFAQNTF
jgi:hypothetical protein